MQKKIVEKPIRLLNIETEKRWKVPIVLRTFLHVPQSSYTYSMKVLLTKKKLEKKSILLVRTYSVDTKLLDSWLVVVSLINIKNIFIFIRGVYHYLVR